jgi:hypothetical protein
MRRPPEDWLGRLYSPAVENIGFFCASRNLPNGLPNVGKTYPKALSAAIFGQIRSRLKLLPASAKLTPSAVESSGRIATRIPVATGVHHKR